MRKFWRTSYVCIVPKLAKLPEKYIYEPWKAPTATQKAAGVLVGSDYPRPIVDHSVVSKGRGSHAMLMLLLMV